MDLERSQRLKGTSLMKRNYIMSMYAEIAGLSFLIVSTAFGAPSQSLQVTGGNVGFLAIGKPSAIKIRGKGAAPQGQIQINGKEIKGELTFDENSLNTGIELRDHHMKEKYLETGKNPTAKFKITKLTLPSEFKSSGFSAEKLPMEGDLTLHGETKPVKGAATISSNAGVATGHIEFGAQITDYKIDIPTYMGVKVADHVDVDVDVQAKPSTEAPTSKPAPAPTQGSQKK
jgi:polyisoprenoid-binding protein YceI